MAGFKKKGFNLNEVEVAVVVVVVVVGGQVQSHEEAASLLQPIEEEEEEETETKASGCDAPAVVLGHNAPNCYEPLDLPT